MGRSSRRTALSVVLGLGLLALAVDRLVLGGQTGATRAAAGAPGITSPQNQQNPAIADPATDVSGADSTPATSPNVALARHFDVLSQELGLDPLRVPDAFEPAASWKPAQDQAQSSQPTRMGESEFRRRHALQAIMVADGRDCAIIGRGLVYLGEVLDGWVLTAIGDRTVTFRAGGDRIELELDRERDSSARRR